MFKPTVTLHTVFSHGTKLVSKFELRVLPIYMWFLSQGKIVEKRCQTVNQNNRLSHSSELVNSREATLELETKSLQK